MICFLFERCLVTGKCIIGEKSFFGKKITLQYESNIFEEKKQIFSRSQLHRTRATVFQMHIFAGEKKHEKKQVKVAILEEKY